MPYMTVPGTDLGYYLICFDKEGRERRDDPDGEGGMLSATVLLLLRDKRYSDVFMVSHGWQGDVPAAHDQYLRWIGAMARNEADIARIRRVRNEFRPLIVGLHWPSLPWGDEDFAADAPSFALGGAQIADPVATYAERIADTPRAQTALRVIFDAAEADVAPPTLPPEVREAYATLEAEAGIPGDGVAGAPGTDHEPFDAERAYQDARESEALQFGTLGAALGAGILTPLRQLSFWKMKDRARSFGESGGRQLLEAVQRTAPGALVHLVGHSFGCIVVSAMTAGARGAGTLPRPISSLVLIQGALSLWSYCPSIPMMRDTQGYFHGVIAGKAVSGPIVTTQSERDRAVRVFYPLGAGAASQVAFEPASSLPRYGAVGSFGIQGLDSGALDMEMLDADHEYGFRPGVVYNLDSTRYICDGGGPAGAHNDIAKQEVAHAIWQAAMACPA
jgi:hypothetical protein